MKNVYIETNGCAVLRHETYKIAKYIELNGFKEVSTLDSADYIIITGCAVIDSNESYAIESIKRVCSESKINSLIIVAGCISTISEKKISDISNEIIQIKNEQLEKLDDFFYTNVKFNDVYYNINPKRHHSFGDPEIKIDENEVNDLKFINKIDEITNKDYGMQQFKYSTRGRHLWKDSDLFEIRVSYGCTGKCIYCATKLAIGDFRSISEEKILLQASDAYKRGYNMIMLMGDEVGAWTENKKNIVDLIENILKINPNFKIGIRYVHPDIIVKNYTRIKLLLEQNSIFYFCSAFQSGSSRILNMMNRNPNIDPFIQCMEDIKNNNYHVFCHTQIIVGFPTETDSDVVDTLNCLQRASFDYVTITPYSPRRGTKAFKLQTLPFEIIKKRVDFFNTWLTINRNSKLYCTIKNEYIQFENDESEKIKNEI